MLLSPASARALPIAEYDRLPRDTKALYLVELLTRARDYLVDRGTTADVMKLSDAFAGEDDKVHKRLFENLETGRSVGRETGKVVEVEHAMLMTLHELGIDIPMRVFMKSMEGYKPER